mmetsp:Transcript_4332/g.6746  ORF Transcript_4332/g.6746 Transcript_4332/m.6746 type:complete len:183 (+) Transcript_4332:3-551(+)
MFEKKALYLIYNLCIATSCKGRETHRETYKLGDHIFTLPPTGEEEMYIAQIDGIFKDRDGEWIDCIWLERAKDMKVLVNAREWNQTRSNLLPGEVFLCTTVNANPIQCIEGHVEILTLEKYEVGRKAMGKGTESIGFMKNKFVCRQALIDAGRKVGGSLTPVVFDPGRGFVVPQNKGKGKHR